MTLDTPTLLLASGAVVTVSALVFIVNTVLRRNDDVGKIWSVAFISGILTTLSYAVWALTPAAWWIVGIGNGAVALSLAAMWSGCRRYNGRRSLLWVSFTGSVLVGVSVIGRGASGGAWAGAAEMFAAVAVFAALACVETLRGRLSRSVNARLLTVVFLVVAGYYVARTVVFVVDGVDGIIFQSYFGTATTTFVTIVLVVLAAITMSVLAAGRFQRDMPSRSAAGIRLIPGVVGEQVFEQLANDWLARAQRDRDNLVLVALDIANLEYMNTAFGREYGDQAVFSVGRIATENAPTAALVAQLRGKRFVILTTAPMVGNGEVVAERLHTALVETPVDPVEGIRAIATCGLATTDRHGYSYPELLKTSLRALQTAEGIGAGSIHLAL